MPGAKGPFEQTLTRCAMSLWPKKAFSHSSSGLKWYPKWTRTAQWPAN